MSPRRSWLIAAAGIVLLGAGVRGVWIFTQLGDAARVRLARLRGYEGCLCGDCRERYGVGPEAWSPHHQPARPTPPESAWIALGAGAAATLAGVLRIWPLRLRLARNRPGCCRGCGYDLSGLLPGKACPECGSPAPAASGT